MLIICEGPDGAGKSTLIGRLGDYVRQTWPSSHVDVWHRGPPIGHPIDEYERPLWDYRPGTGRHVICDRWHVGERVYPTVLGRRSRMDEASWQHIELFLRSRGAVLVHVDADVDTLVERVKLRGDDLIKPKMLVDVRNLFWNVCTTQVRLPSWYVDVQSADDEASRSIVMDALNNELEMTCLARFVTYVGPRRPRLLLLGERRGRASSRSTRDDHAPAFVPYPATSGAYLLNAIGRDVQESGIGVANACDVDDPEKLWVLLGKPEVVTLGTLPDRALGPRVPHRTTSHPQYVRRFFHAQQAAYADHVLGRTTHAPWKES